MDNYDFDIYTCISDFNFDVKNITQTLIGNNELLRKFVKYAISEEKHAWRAAWIISKYSEQTTEDLNIYADGFINAAKEIQADGHLREILKIIVHLNLNEDQNSEVFDLCLSLLQDNRRQSSVRSIAFQFLIKISKDYPELRNEISIIFDNIKDYLSHGIRYSMMKKLKNSNLVN